jgi:hypothetical protein
MYEHDVIRRSGYAIQRVLHGLLTMLAARNEFHVLLKDVVGVGLEPFPKALDLVLAQCHPDFTDGIDCGKFSQRMDQNGSPSQLCELLGGIPFPTPCVAGARSGRHARPQSSSGNDNDDLHGGL